MAERHILEAYWETRDRGVAVLTRDWTDNERMPPLQIDPGARPLRLVRRVSPQVYGRRAGYFLSGTEVAFILWPPFYPNLDWEDEDLFVAGDFNGWSKAVGDVSWQMRRETFDGQGCLVLRVPRARCGAEGPVRFKFITGESRWQELPPEAINRVSEDFRENFLIEPTRTGLHIFHFWSVEVHQISEHELLVWAEDGARETCPITNHENFLSLSTTRPLGALVEAHRTTFTVFAPRATRVTVCVYVAPGGPLEWKVDMSRHDDGCWEASVPKNLHGQFYDFRVDGENTNNSRNFDPNACILDPYATAAAGRAGPGLIVDPAGLPLARSCFIPPSWHDLVILETHVRDLIAHAPLEMDPVERRGFKGLAKWLRQPDCYLRQLGINTVELQPVQEFDCVHAEDYHWGYMPVNYFSPASAYATAPERGSQVEEFHDLVAAFHEAGMAVILDVVYNHAGEPNHLYFLDKYYYFTCTHDGQLTNWSGCGNDLRTNTPMVRRIIIESLIHLVQTYDVDGFRFDLADLVGLAALKEVEAALKAVKPSIILIAEPWSYKGHITHALRHTGWSSWNDRFRDFATQYVLGQGNQDGLRFFLAGSPGDIALWPAQTVNYVQSHDDRAWVDRITENANFRGDAPTPNDIRRHHLMVAVLMSALGIPMLAQGQDFLQSKQGVNNTYLRGDLNALDYGRIAQYAATHEYFCAWIRFRLSAAGQHFRHHQHPAPGYFGPFGVPGTSATGLLYNADFSLGGDRLFFAINPHAQPVVMETFELKPEDFRQLADHEHFCAEGLKDAGYVWRDGKLELPAMSVGLWRQEG
jgi:pullulanase/glycogen debranching enzyme